MRHFDSIATALTNAMRQLQLLGFRLETGYVFGFSFGGQLATEAGRRLGQQRLAEVDSKSLSIMCGCWVCSLMGHYFLLAQPATWPVQASIIVRSSPTTDWPPGMYNACTRPAVRRAPATIAAIRTGVSAIVARVRQPHRVHRAVRTVFVRTFMWLPSMRRSKRCPGQKSALLGALRRPIGRWAFGWVMWSRENCE